MEEKRKEQERIQKEKEEKIRNEEEEEERFQEEEEEEEEKIRKEEEKKEKKEKIRNEEEEEERIKKEKEEKIRKEEEERIKKEKEEKISNEEEERFQEEEEEKINKNDEECNNLSEEENQKIIESDKNSKQLKEEKFEIEENNEEKKMNQSNVINKEELEKGEKKSLNQNSKDVESEHNISLIPEKLKNSKLFMSLSEEHKNMSISILKDIQKLRKNKTNNFGDIDIYPTILLDFNEKEKTLDNLIPHFSDKIKNEDKNDIEKRKNSFINHIYFEGKIGTNPLLELIPDCQISHIDLLQKINDEEHLKNIPKISNDYEEQIFSEEYPLISEYYSPIGELDDLKGFIYKYNLEGNTKLYLNCFKNFNYWRNIKGDGNSFYRTFMFGLIEHYILNRNEEELNQVFSEISSDKLIKVYQEYNLNIKKSFIILGAILDLLSKDKIEKAYDLFLKSYLLKDGSFDEMLVIYLRYITFIYVDEVIKLSENEKVQEEREERITAKGINIELIKSMNIEPNFFIICLMPYLFDVNINIFWIDKDLIQSKDGIINFIDEENTENIPLISFGYFYSSYFRIYSNNFTQENEEINEIFKLKLNKLSKLTLEIKIPNKCQICKSETFIIFVKQKYKICKKCLDNYINQICSIRIKSLKNDNYIGLEYYSRAINLKDNYTINDYEFIEIKEETNIINYLQNLASIICSKCKQNFDKKNLNNLKCKCLLCDKCLENMILELTDGLKILNSFEKRKLNKKCTSCGGHFIYENSIEHLKDIKEIDKENAIKRMCDYVNTLCLVCGEKVRKKQDINEPNSKDNNEMENEEDNNKEKKKEIFKEIKNYKRLKIRRETDQRKGIDYLDIEHVICINCYEKMKSNNFLNEEINSENSSNKKKGKKKKNNNSTSSDDEDKRKNNKYYVNFDEEECFCFICNKKHYLIDKNIKNGGCCTSGCYIN